MFIYLKERVTERRTDTTEPERVRETHCHAPNTQAGSGGASLQLHVGLTMSCVNRTFETSSDVPQNATSRKLDRKWKT